MSQPEPENTHPLYQQGSHPLRDAPQPKAPPRPQQKGIPIPMNAERPLVTQAIIAINVLIFVLRYVAPDFAQELLIFGASIPEWIQLAGLQESYRLFTSMFLHANEAHIMFNMVALYYIGSYLEKTFGHIPYLAIYLIGGLTGSVLSFMFQEGGIGASGAVFAIWGAEVVYLGIHRQLFGEFARKRLQNSVMLMGVNFLFGLVVNSTSEGAFIGNMAHLGGLIGGLIMTWIVSPRLTVERYQDENGVFRARIRRQELFSLQMPVVIGYTVLLVVIYLLVFGLRGA